MVEAGKVNGKLGNGINYLWLPLQQITFHRTPSNQECNCALSICKKPVSTTSWSMHEAFPLLQTVDHLVLLTSRSLSTQSLDWLLSFCFTPVRKKSFFSRRNHFVGYTPVPLYHPQRTVIYMEIVLWWGLLSQNCNTFEAWSTKGAKMI